MKKCIVCKKEKSLLDFGKDKSCKDGYSRRCKECSRKDCYKYRKSKDGIVSTLYSNQKARSKRKGFGKPTYSKKELEEWLFSQKLFHELYNEWKMSGYDRMKSPSVDRKNDYIGYTLSNIQLMRWEENKDKWNCDKVNGINNKQNKAVLQFDTDGNFICEFFSIAEATRKTKANGSSIIKVIKGELKTANGFKWKYKESEIE